MAGPLNLSIDWAHGTGVSTVGRLRSNPCDGVKETFELAAATADHVVSHLEDGPGSGPIPSPGASEAWHQRLGELTSSVNRLVIDGGVRAVESGMEEVISTGTADEVLKTVRAKPTLAVGDVPGKHPREVSSITATANYLLWEALPFVLQRSCWTRDTYTGRARGSLRDREYAFLFGREAWEFAEGAWQHDNHVSDVSLVLARARESAFVLKHVARDPAMSILSKAGGVLGPWSEGDVVQLDRWIRCVLTGAEACCAAVLSYGANPGPSSEKAMLDCATKAHSIILEGQGPSIRDLGIFPDRRSWGRVLSTIAAGDSIFLCSPDDGRELFGALDVICVYIETLRRRGLDSIVPTGSVRGPGEPRPTAADITNWAAVVRGLCTRLHHGAWL